jgi:hypothetical protein
MPKFKATIKFRQDCLHYKGTVEIESKDYAGAMSLLGTSIQDHMELPQGGIWKPDRIEIILKKDPMFTCSECGKRFRTVENALLHKTSSH